MNFTVFDALPVTVANQGTWVWAINDSGVCCGYVDDDAGTEHGFVRAADGSITVVDATIDAHSTTFRDINNAGTIAGEYNDASRVYHGLIRASTGILTVVDVPTAGTDPLQGTRADSINENGDIAGSYVDGSGVQHCFTRLADGTIDTFDLPAGCTLAAIGPCINNDVTVVGTYINIGGDGIYHGFIRTSDGTFTTFDTPSAGTVFGSGTRASHNGFNNAGIIVGNWANDSLINRGYIRDANGNFTEFDVYTNTTVNVVIGDNTGAMAGGIIDDNNISHGFIATDFSQSVVGSYQEAGALYTGFLRADDGTLTNFTCPGAGTTPGAGQGTIPMDVALGTIPPPPPPANRPVTAVCGEMPSLEVTRDLDCDWTDSSTFYITQDTPMPFTLRALVLRMSYNQD